MTILLSTYQGERFLPEQLVSLAGQTHDAWQLLWRDDGSSDRSIECVTAFAGAHPGRVIHLETYSGNLGAAESFLYLLAHAPEHGLFAFCDQDDVWLPQKLARAVRALREIGEDIPALYCSRQFLIDENCKFLRSSQRPKRAPSFENALVQNIATGCTMVMNARARAVMLSAKMPANSMHDWWAYLTVTAAGGRILFDEKPSLLYRQHGANTVGDPGGILARAVGALKRGPERFWQIFDAHLDALQGLSALTPAARQTIRALHSIWTLSPPRRLYRLGRTGIHRQGRLGDLALRVSVLSRRV